MWRRRIFSNSIDERAGYGCILHSTEKGKRKWKLLNRKNEFSMKIDVVRGIIESYILEMIEQD